MDSEATPYFDVSGGKNDTLFGRFRLGIGGSLSLTLGQYERRIAS